MAKSYNSKYKHDALLLIEQGYSNKEIVARLRCHAKYPSVLRGILRKMSEAERKAEFDQARQSTLKEAAEPKQPEKTTSFKTPYSCAKGRTIISRY